MSEYRFIPIDNGFAIAHVNERIGQITWNRRHKQWRVALFGRKLGLYDTNTEAVDAVYKKLESYS